MATATKKTAQASRLISESMRKESRKYLASDAFSKAAKSRQLQYDDSPPSEGGWFPENNSKVEYSIVNYAVLPLRTDKKNVKRVTGTRYIVECLVNMPGTNEDGNSFNVNAVAWHRTPKEMAEKVKGGKKNFSKELADLRAMLGAALVEGSDTIASTATDSQMVEILEALASAEVPDTFKATAVNMIRKYKKKTDKPGEETGEQMVRALRSCSLLEAGVAGGEEEFDEGDENEPEEEEELDEELDEGDEGGE